MKKRNQIISFLCTMTMIISLLAGCAGPANMPNETSAPDVTTVSDVDKATDATSGEAEDPAVEPEQKLPISEEGITLTVAIPVNSKVEDISTNELTLYIEEQTGINLEFIELSTSETATQINALMNGGELPDIIVGYNFGYDALCSYADAGLLLPLDEYVDKWGYNLKNTIMTDPDLGDNPMAYATYDRHLWAMPSGGALVTNVYGKYQTRIQSNFLDELGLNRPETLDEFRNYLEKVHEKHPNVIPWSSYADANYIFGNISQAFQYTDLRTYLKVSDGKVEFIGNNDLFKEAVEYMKDMVDEGLIDPASFTQDKSVMATLEAQEGAQFGALGCGYNYTQVVADGGDEKSGLWILGTLEGPHGYKSTQVAVEAANVRRAMVVTSACQYPEEAFRLFDFFLSDDFAMTARVGFEGVQWKKAEEGVLGRDGEQAWFSLLKTQEWVEPSTNVIWANESFIHSNIMNHCEAAVSTDKYPNANEIANQKLADKVSGEALPQLVMDVEKTAEYNELKTLIVDGINAGIASFVLGTRDLAEWDEFCAELDAMGVERYVELAQAAYTEMTK